MNNQVNDEFFDNYDFYQNIDPKLEFEWNIEATAVSKCIQQINLFAILSYKDAGAYISTYKECVQNQILYLKRIMTMENLNTLEDKTNTILNNKLEI